MPKQYLPDQAAFETFFNDLRDNLHCRRLSGTEVVSLVSRLPKKEDSEWKKGKRGLETCYVYERADRPVSVVIWTTYVTADRAARDQDAGWVLLVDRRFPDAPCFYSFPIHRTKNFLKTFRKWIAAFIEIVDHWPAPCVRCGESPTIRLVRAGVMHAVMFDCPKGHALPTAWIYQGLQDKPRKFLESAFRRYHDYRMRIAESGDAMPTPRRVLRSQAKEKRAVQMEGSQENGLADKYPFGDLDHCPDF